MHWGSVPQSFVVGHQEGIHGMPGCRRHIVWRAGPREKKFAVVPCSRRKDVFWFDNRPHPFA